MIKQFIISSVAAAGLLVSAQATAHNTGGTVVWNNSAHGHSHSHHVKPQRRAPKFRVNKEQREQAQMIKQGIKTCQITPAEAKILNKQQKRINKAESRMRADGLQRWERQKLKQRLHNARVQINKLTKNNKKCGRKNKRKHSFKHSHNGKHHSHANGRHFHNHARWNISNRHGSFSFSIGH